MTTSAGEPIGDMAALIETFVSITTGFPISRDSAFIGEKAFLCQTRVLGGFCRVLKGFAQAIRIEYLHFFIVLIADYDPHNSFTVSNLFMSLLLG